MAAMAASRRICSAGLKQLAGARSPFAAGLQEGVFHGTAVHPGMMTLCNPVIHGHPARYFNIFPCSHADAKTSLTTIGMPSTIMNGMKPAFLDFAGGVKRTFSSSAPKSNNHKFSMEAEMAARQGQDAAFKPESVYETRKKDADTTIVLMAFTCVNFLYLSARDNARSNNSSSRCLNCRNCPCQGSNPQVQQDYELPVP
jgi:hypothetical protein